MSVTVGAALKKIAVSILTDKKALKTVGGILLGIIILICLPVVAIVSILNGDIQFDEARLQQIVVQNLSAEEKDRLKAVTRANSFFSLRSIFRFSFLVFRKIEICGGRAGMAAVPL